MGPQDSAAVPIAPATRSDVDAIPLAPDDAPPLFDAVAEVARTMRYTLTSPNYGAGQAFVLRDETGARFEIYGNISQLHLELRWATVGLPRASEGALVAMIAAAAVAGAGSARGAAWMGIALGGAGIAFAVGVGFVVLQRRAALRRYGAFKAALAAALVALRDARHGGEYR
jgi:hypothetical protein